MSESQWKRLSLKPQSDHSTVQQWSPFNNVRYCVWLMACMTNDPLIERCIPPQFRLRVLSRRAQHKWTLWTFVRCQCYFRAAIYWTIMFLDYVLRILQQYCFSTNNADHYSVTLYSDTTNSSIAEQWYFLIYFNSDIFCLFSQIIRGIVPIFVFYLLLLYFVFYFIYIRWKWHSTRANNNWKVCLLNVIMLKTIYTCKVAQYNNI